MIEKFHKANDEEAFIRVINDVVTEVSQDFEKLTGYEEKELLGRTFKKAFKLLSNNENMSLDYASWELSRFIFTKNLEMREVIVQVSPYNDEKEIKYVFKEVPNSRIKEKFAYVEQICRENFRGFAVYSVPDLTLLTSCERYLEIFEEPFKSLDRVIGHKIYEFTKNFEGSDVEIMFRRVIETGRSIDIKEYKFESASRGTTYWNSTVVPVSEGDRVRYLVVEASNVTEIVRNRERITQQSKVIVLQNEQLIDINRQLEAVLDNVSDNLAVINKEGNYVRLNKARRGLDRLYNVTSMKEIHKHFKFFDMKGEQIYPENMPKELVLRGEKVHKFKMRITNGMEEMFFEVNATPIYDEQGNFTMGLLCSNDISEVVKHEKFIEKQRDNMFRIIQNLDLPIIRVSYPDYKIIDYNKKAFNDMLKSNYIDGSSEKEISNEAIIKLFEKQDIEEFIRRLVKIQHTKLPFYMKNIRFSKDGASAYINLICQPILDSEDNVVDILIVFVDVTNEIRKNLMLEIVLKEQEEFFANISHELKTPLNVIFSALQMLNLILKKGIPDQRPEKYLDVMKQNCYRLIRLVNNIIDVSKIEAGHYPLCFKKYNIVNLIENITMSVIEFVESKHLSITFDTDVEEKVMACDSDVIERIMLNLLSNAVKFSKPKDEISVIIKDLGNKVEIAVKDTGIGIPEEKLNAIFERFKQVDKSLSRKQEGSGIGLSLVKSLVHMHGGQITVSSIEGEGSEFIVTLPATLKTEQDCTSFEEIKEENVERIQIEFSDIYD